MATIDKTPRATTPSGTSPKAEPEKFSVVKMPSPNSSPRPAGTKIDTIVLHHTAGGGTAQDTGRYFQNPANQVSSNYVIGKDGTIVQPVEDDRRSWHAGESEFDGRRNVNDFSIGIEIVNMGDGKDPYPDEQYQALAKLVTHLQRKYGIPWERIVGHKDVALPRGRKIDPSANFNYEKLRQEVEKLTGGAVPEFGGSKAAPEAAAAPASDAAQLSPGGRSSGMSLPSGSSGGSGAGGSSGGASGGGGSSGGGGASGGGGSTSGAPRSGSAPRSGGTSGASGSSGGYAPKVDWQKILDMAATEGNLSQSDAEAFVQLLKNGNQKGAKKLLKDKGLSDAKANSLIEKAVGQGGRQAAIAAILNDAEIQQAFKDWPRLSTEQKLKIGAKISDIQGQAMGFTPAPLSRDPNLAKAGQTGTYGLWSSRNGIGISDAALASPAMFLNTVVHEQAHKMNWQEGKAPSARHDSGKDAVYDIGNDFEQAVFGSRSLNGVK
ncbi:1,6-anhydro-N-acetylmuramyl-L-alanine amidase AmpD [compost metagenome]